MDRQGSLPSLLMEAALSAAVADGVIPSFNDDGNKKVDGGGVESGDVAGVDMTAQRQPPVLENSSGSNVKTASDYNPGVEMLNHFAGDRMIKVDPTSLMTAAAAQSQVTLEVEPAANVLRRGKWTSEEEAYANRLIQEFKAGLLPLTDGTTLRTFLSKLLNCDPMRISKKFVGGNCIGKQVFRRRSADVNNLTHDEIEQTRFELSELERKFLDRVSQSKCSRGVGSGGASKKVSEDTMSSSRGGGGLGNKMNKSAAAAGRALLLGNNSPQTNTSQDSTVIDGAGGLLAQLRAENPGMFDSNTAGSFLGVGSHSGGLGNAISNPSIANLMLQTGMSRDQLSLLSGKGLFSSASLANMFGKQRSFDELMRLDFQSMQSIDNLANLIQNNMPSAGRVPTAQMKNVEWGAQWAGAPAPGPSTHGGGSKGSIDNLVRVLSGDKNIMSDTNNITNNANATNFTNFIHDQAHQGNNLAGGAPSNDFTNFIQSLTQQQHNQQHVNNANFSNILQNIASGNVGGNSLLLNKNANNVSGANQNLGGSNDFMNMLKQSGSTAGNIPQQQGCNPFMQQLNSQFGGANHLNPMMQFLAQAGGGNNTNMANLLNQQNGHVGLAAGMNNHLGNFGTALGNNFGNFGSNFNSSPAANQPNTVALLQLQQLIAQQNGTVGTNNNQTVAPNAPQGLAQNSSGGNNLTLGNKRRIDDLSSDGENNADDRPGKKQMVAL